MATWEQENVDAILKGSDLGFAVGISAHYLRRFVSAIDPKSDTMAMICRFFEYENNFPFIKRPDFPQKRATHNRRTAAYSQKTEPLGTKRNELNRLYREQTEAMTKADRFEQDFLGRKREETYKQLTELERTLSDLRRQKPKEYQNYYGFRKGRIVKAHKTDVTQLKNLLEATEKKAARLVPDPVYTNLETLADLLEWPQLERDAAKLVWAIHNSGDFKKLVGELMPSAGDKEPSFNHFAAICLGRSREDISRAFSPASELFLSGVLVKASGSDNHMPRFSDALVKILDQPDMSLDFLMRNLIGERGTTQLDLAKNFNYVAEHVPHVEKLVQSALEQHRRGQNIIIYGLQDSGKTEFTKALAKALDVPIFMLGEANADSSQPKLEDRLARVLLAKRLTTHMDKVILAVDEAEDLLRINTGEKDAAGISKIYLNRLLENGFMTVWIVNDIEHIHPAVRRRFKYSVPFGPLTARDRKEAWTNIAAAHKLDLKPAEITELADKYEVPVGSIVTAVENAAMTTRDKAGAERSLRSTGNFVFGDVPAILSHNRSSAPYYPELENFAEIQAQRTPAQMRETLLRHAGNPVRIFAHGPIGSGKKSLFRQIAQETGREFLHYNILGLFSQGSDEYLSRVLSDALNKPSLIAWDGMAVMNAIPSYHPSAAMVRGTIEQLSELIPGMQVFCSNVKDAPPQWLRRLYPFVIKHDYLETGQVKKAWPLFFGASEPRKTGNYSPLTPGDFATIVRRNRGLVDVPAEKLMADLAEVSKGTAAEAQQQPPQAVPALKLH